MGTLTNVISTKGSTSEVEFVRESKIETKGLLIGVNLLNYCLAKEDCTLGDPIVCRVEAIIHQ